MEQNNQKGLYIFGISTTAKTLFTFIRKYNLFDVKGFIVDKGYRNSEVFLGLPVIELDLSSPVIQSILNNKEFVFVAILWNRLNSDRKDVYYRLKEIGFTFTNIISPTSLIHGEIIGDNCWISDFVLAEPNSVINNNVFIKSKAWIGSNSKIESHCFIGANSSIMGGCIIGEQSFIGVNATIFDERKIGKKCIVGAATVVKRNLPDFSIIKTSSIHHEIIQCDNQSIELKLLSKKNVK